MSTPKSLLEDNLLKNCSELKSGTVLLSTNNNKSCQIVLKDGKITAVSMGRVKGIPAILEIKDAGLKGASFNERLQLPYTDDAIIDSHDEALKLLGFDKEDLEDSTAREIVDDSAILEEPSSKSGQTYRGQIIEASGTPAANKSTAKAEAKKPARMYRGQVIED